jgi:2,3-bisphosphoglycerate-dependent phosphoglycerate mutase
VNPQLPIQFQQAIKQLWHNPSLSLFGCESNVDAADRGYAFLNSIVTKESNQFSPNMYTVIGTHGNLLTLILQLFYPRIGYNFWCKMSFPDIFIVSVICKPNGKLILDPTQEQQNPSRIWQA